MPTARELLEQADALMRRNRQDAARAPLMPAVPAAVEQHAPVPIIDAGPRIVAEAPHAHPAPETTPPVAPARPAVVEPDIPVLDDVVDASGDDDVPLLTDAIDEIEIDVAAPTIDEGEPSDWLTPPAEDESILGPSPPSVALVPPATYMPPAVGHRPVVAAPAFVSAAPTKAEPPPDLEDFHPEPVDADVTIRRTVPMLGAPSPEIRATLPEIEDLAESGTMDGDADVTWTRPLRAAPVSEIGPSAGTTADTAATDAAEPFESSPTLIEDVASPVVATQRALPTGADREALAEEIRMQVLQRIDMFTDRGLGERLGERLKPIVDRASADLVDAINQHVGEILRAYVAEAIEREIDRWRSSR